MPFDQFTIEQIAGDLLPGATADQRIATGFHRNTMLNEEGGIDPLEYRFKAMVDRVATTGATWLGLTLQCCQCHTHKYDPIPHREYYSMMAFLDNADEPTLESAQSGSGARSRSKDCQGRRTGCRAAAQVAGSRFIDGLVHSSPRCDHRTHRTHRGPSTTARFCSRPPDRLQAPPPCSFPDSRGSSPSSASKP